MKRLFTIATIALSCLVLSSCGVTYMPGMNSNVNETKIVLSERNFNVLREAQGIASATYVCGIGGLSKTALRSNAIDEMTRNAALKGSQTIANITTHSTFKMITPFYVKVTYVATGYVVEFY